MFKILNLRSVLASQYSQSRSGGGEGEQKLAGPQEEAGQDLWAILLVLMCTSMIRVPHTILPRMCGQERETGSILGSTLIQTPVRTCLK